MALSSLMNRLSHKERTESGNNFDEFNFLPLQREFDIKYLTENDTLYIKTRLWTAHRNCFRASFDCFRKMINLEIIEEDSYEKDALFYVELGEPLLQGGEYWVFRFMIFWYTIKTENHFPLYYSSFHAKWDIEIGTRSENLEKNFWSMSRCKVIII